MYGINFSMELCRKMDSSHYYAGITDINTNQLYNTDSDKNNASNIDIQMSYSDDDFTKSSSSNHNSRPCLQNNEFIPDPGYNIWNSDMVECKQEVDPSVKTNNNNLNNNNNNLNNNINNSKNYNMDEEYNKPFPYFHSYYNSPSYINNYKNTHSTPNLLHHNHYQQRPPYRVSATKNQMQSWYPSSINKQQFSQKNQLNQQQSYKTSYLSSSLTTPETEVPTSPPEHMRNMIHLTNR